MFELTESETNHYSMPPIHKISVCKEYNQPFSKRYNPASSTKINWFRHRLVKADSSVFHIFYVKCQTLIENRFSLEELKRREKIKQYSVFLSEEQYATHLTQNNVYCLYATQYNEELLV